MDTETPKRSRVPRGLRVRKLTHLRASPILRLSHTAERFLRFSFLLVRRVGPRTCGSGKQQREQDVRRGRTADQSETYSIQGL